MTKPKKIPTKMRKIWRLAQIVAIIAVLQLAVLDSDPAIATFVDFASTLICRKFLSHSFSSFIQRQQPELRWTMESSARPSCEFSDYFSRCPQGRSFMTTKHPQIARPLQQTRLR